MGAFLRTIYVKVNHIELFPGAMRGGRKRTFQIVSAVRKVTQLFAVLLLKVRSRRLLAAGGAFLLHCETSVSFPPLEQARTDFCPGNQMHVGISERDHGGCSIL